MKDDELEDSIVGLKGELPKGRPNLSESDKDDLIRTVGGPRTAQSIIKAKKDFPMRRIIFLFNALDSQAVVDILANDMTAALQRAQAK